MSRFQRFQWFCSLNSSVDFDNTVNKAGLFWPRLVILRWFDGTLGVELGFLRRHLHAHFDNSGVMDKSLASSPAFYSSLFVLLNSTITLWKIL